MRIEPELVSPGGPEKTQEMAREHPLLAGVAQCAEVLDGLVEANPVFLTAEEKAELITACVALESRVYELRLRVMAEAVDVVEDSPQRSMGQWLETQCGVYRTTALRDARLAEALGVRVFLADALRAGAVTRDQAGVIVQALERLPEELDADLLGEAERYLVDQARSFGPHELRQLGEKVLEVIAPDSYDRLEALRLARLEDHARTAARLTLTARGDGLTQISGRLPDVVAIRLATYLHAFTNPRRPENQNVFGDPEGLAAMPYPQRAAEAFAQLLETWDPKRLPVHGGDATTVMVTMTLDQLRTELATAGLLDAPDDESESKISAHEARRLACNAKLVPVVLGSTSEVLDQGRGARLFQRAQHRALVLRDRTCRTEGCHVPGTWSEAHHWIAWTHGGTTDMTNAVLLCRYHHGLAHSPLWIAERLTNGDVRFERRQ